MSQPGYPSKTPTSKPPILSVYDANGVKTRAPAASKFGVGATHIAQIKDATEQRRAHSEALSNPGRAGYKKQSPLS
jgi:hypothetical protein